MIKVTEQSMTVCPESLREFDHMLEPGCQGAGDPGAKELARGLFRTHFPKPAEILLEKVCLKKWPVEAFNPLEVRQGVMIEFFAPFEEEETTALQGLPVITVQFLIEIPLDRIDGFVHHRDDVVRVMNNGGVVVDLSDSEQIRRPHIHGDGLQRCTNRLESSKKWNDGVGTSSLGRVEDLSGFEIENDSHVVMAFPDGEFVDSDQPDRLERPFFQSSSEMAFEDLFDQCSSDTKKHRHVLDRSYLAKIDNISFQGLGVASFAL